MSHSSLGFDSQGNALPASAITENELPKGWRWVRVKDVGNVQLGRQRAPQHQNGANMRPYLRVANVFEDRIDLSDVLTMNFTPREFETFALRANDILLNEGQSLHLVGRPALYRDELPGACFQNTLVRFRAGPDVDPKFALTIFRGYMHTGKFQKIARWTTNIAHLGAQRFAEMPFPLPPLPEQRRIVAEIEKQFTRLEAGVAALRRVQANLKRYRAAVLKAACEGRLVPTEAELQKSGGKGQKSKAKFETGEALLARILAERRQNWQGRGPYKEPAALDAAKLFQLPTGWTWTTLDALAAIKGGITKDQNRKHTAPARSVPYLRVANVQRGYIDLTEVKEIATTEDEIQELALKPGDILFNEGGDRDKLGRGWVWNAELPECIHQNHVYRARLHVAELNPKLISWYANTFGQKFFFDEGKHTTNLASISMTKLKGLPVPIPPPVEQTRIVAEVERRLSVVAELESVVSANLQRATRLRQSILQKAFTGEL